MVKCPFCGYEAGESNFKLPREPWKFRFYTVRMMECPKCHGTFNYYYGVNHRMGKVLEFMIRVKPRKRWLWIVEYNESMQYVAPHENVRLMVVELLKQLYRGVLRESALLKSRMEYTLLELLFETLELIPLIMPQEIYAVDGSRIRVDMAFGRKVVFELKSDPSEFDKAYRDALSKYLPSPHLASAEYFIITNYDYWRIYKITSIGNRIELDPIAVDEPRSKIVSILKTQILPAVEPKLPAHPDVISKLFKIKVEKLITDIKNVFVNVKDDARIMPLYEA